MAPLARIQCSAALVSRPPENAIPTFSPAGSVCRMLGTSSLQNDDHNAEQINPSAGGVEDVVIRRIVAQDARREAAVGTDGPTRLARPGDGSVNQPRPESVATQARGHDHVVDLDQRGGSPVI